MEVLHSAIPIFAPPMYTVSKVVIIIFFSFTFLVNRIKAGSPVQMCQSSRAQIKSFNSDWGIYRHCMLP